MSCIDFRQWKNVRSENKTNNRSTIRSSSTINRSMVFICRCYRASSWTAVSTGARSNLHGLALNEKLLNAVIADSESDPSALDTILKNLEIVACDIYYILFPQSGDLKRSGSKMVEAFNVEVRRWHKGVHDIRTVKRLQCVSNPKQVINVALFCWHAWGPTSNHVEDGVLIFVLVLLNNTSLLITHHARGLTSNVFESFLGSFSKGIAIQPHLSKRNFGLFSAVQCRRGGFFVADREN